MSEKKSAAESQKPAPDAGKHRLGDDELEVISGGAVQQIQEKGKKG